MVTSPDTEQLGRFAQAALACWDLPADAKVRRLNLSENATFLVEATGEFKAVLRIHREGYHTRRAIECELAWLDALSESTLKTPQYYLGRDGDPVQEVRLEELNGSRFAVLFHFIEGEAPRESGTLAPLYEQIGATAARCHAHALTWVRPEHFERLVWDVDAVFGPQSPWGDWRDAPEVTAEVRGVLERVERTVRARLETYGKAPERFNLIHGDMRLANLIVGGEETHLIDFDDCGFGWLMYDFAAAVSFIEDDPRIPEFQSAWLCGYRSVRPLAKEDIAELPTFVMLRRLALLAWIGSHLEAPEPRALAPGFAKKTMVLGQEWLASIASSATS